MAGRPLTGDALGILVSDRVDRDHGARIDAIAADSGMPIRRITTPRDAAELGTIGIALFSRDLYEGSSVRRPAPLSDSFFAIVDSAPRLRWLHVFSAGLDLPPYRPSLARGVQVTGSSGATAPAIAQSLLAAVLSQSRGFNHWLDAQQRRQWLPLQAEHRPRPIEGQRVVVVGAGPIALEIGRLLGAVGFHTTSVRRRAGPTPPFHQSVTVDVLDAQLPGCDWLVLACPLDDSTRGLIDARRLALLPATARLTNVARGELVDEDALIDSLRHRRLAGAFLDVFCTEPLPADSPLWTLPGVWITPHNCAASLGHEDRVVESFLSQLGPWLRDSHSPRRALPEVTETNRHTS